MVIRTMAIFIIVAERGSPDLDADLTRLYGTDSYKIADNQWLVASSEKRTTKEVLDGLDANKGKFGRIAAFSISGYNGFHKTDMWEWIKTHWE